MSLKEKLKKSIVDTLGEDYQASVAKGHEKAKKELIGLGDEDTAAGGGPYKEKASMKRSKSAPPAAAPMVSPLEEAEPAKGTGKKPKGSTRRLYTDENPSDTVPIKFKTVGDVQDTLSRSDYKSKSHARKSQIIQVIKQRACVAAKNAKKPETKTRLNKVCKYATKRAEAHKKKTNETVLQEALSDRLYHYTYVGTILDILEKDHFLPSVAFERPSEEEVGRDYKYFISFARNLRGTFHKEGRGSGYFVVNGRKLSQNYKGSAIDYWERAKFDPKATKETEAEDRLFTNKPYVKDAAKYIEAVHISAPYQTKYSSGRVQEEKYSEGLVDNMKKVAELGKSKGIPVYYHTDLGSYRMANDKKAVDFAQWTKGAADAGIIEPAVARIYTPGPPDLMRLETAVNAIEELLIKGTSYKDFLDTLSSEELSYVRRRLFYSFGGNDIASRIRDELNIYKTKPEARPFIARLGRALTKLKMNLAEIGIKLGDLVQKAVRGLNEDVTVKVLGYVKPDSAFHTLDGWENFANRVLRLQKQGASVRGGEIKGSDELVELINSFFSFQLDTEVERYELLTRKNVIDFIEDFVNHRFWGLKREFGSYFPDIDKLRFAYFYSRGDMEPYVLIDDEFTKQFYGGLDNPLELKHYTSVNGIERIQKAIDKGDAFDISAFTVMTQPFFRETSDKIITFKGNVRAAFRSDVKSFATSTGRRAVNMYRLEYPGEEENICPDLETLCADDTDTSLWNEIIATPMEILKVEDVSDELNEDEEARASFAKGLEKASLKDPGVDSSKYQRVPRRSTKVDYAKAGRLIKQLYAKLADRAFLNSLKTVHWGGRAEMINIVKNYQNLKRDELSASAYLPSEAVYKVGPFGMDFGVLIKGYVTLLANNMDDISSGSGKAYKEELPPERTASSGANKGVGRVRYPGDYERFKIFVFDKEDYDPEKDWAGGPRNEALVDNWKIEAVIIPDNEDAEKNKKNFAKYLEKVGIDAKVVTHKEL